MEKVLHNQQIYSYYKYRSEEKFGKSYNMVNSYVQNRQQPRLEILFEIAKNLDFDPKELIKSEHE